MMRDKVIPVLWLLAAAVIVGTSIGVSARADEPTDCWPTTTIDVPELNGTLE